MRAAPHLLLAVALPALAPPAMAQCATRDAFVASLAREHGEHAAGRGVNQTGNLVELFVSASTWTLVVTMPGGVSCIATHGELWETVPLLAPGRGS